MQRLANLNQNRYRYLEPTLIALVFGVSALMGYYSVETPVLLHLFYVPVVLTGALQGKHRARLMALLCILSSLIIFVPNLNANSGQGIPFATVAVFLLWGATLVLIAIIVGSLSDGWRSAMAKLTEAHRKDVLTDSLTGVSNRRAYEFELSRRIAEWKRNETSVSLILVDIDYFKKFNDRYGHQAGDAVLKAVAEVLNNTVRDTDLIARYGGEEFAVVASGTGVDETKEIAERIRSLIESARFPFNGLILRLTVSVGFAQIREGEDATAFVQRADAALYSSKEAGRNCVHFHDGTTCQQFGHGMATQIADSSNQDNNGRGTSDPYTDESTGLPSQKVFLEELRRRTAERNRYGTKLSLAIVEFVEDLDDSAHDAHARKSLLATISKLASSVLRDTDLITRYDSNSLGILLPATELRNALVPLGRMRANAAAYADSKYANLNYAVSIGAVEVLPEEHPGSALQRVEASIKSATEAGGDQVVWHDGNECILLELQSEAEVDA
ncbi:MAG: diguanylate cyclase [Planctomycetota bacterium]